MKVDQVGEDPMGLVTCLSLAGGLMFLALFPCGLVGCCQHRQGILVCQLFPEWLVTGGRFAVEAEGSL